MSSPAATTETWHLNGHMIIANSCISKILNRCSDTMHIPEEQNSLLLNSSYRYVTKPVIRMARPFLSASHPSANLYSPTITQISSKATNISKPGFMSWCLPSAILVGESSSSLLSLQTAISCIVQDHNKNTNNDVLAQLSYKDDITQGM